MMTTTAKLLLAAAGVAMVSTYAVGEEAQFTRKRTSQAMMKQDSAQCWQLAQKARLTEAQANQNLAAGYLVGGVVGVLITASENEDANKNPKSTFRRQVHDACMEKRGYKKAE
jgi:S-methylmethionine-dependent homocysteine/selenocysteine methylase